MENLTTSPQQIKPFEDLDLRRYQSEADLKALEEDINTYNITGDKAVMGRIHTKFRVSGGSKSGNTELRIAGALIKMIKAKRLSRKRCQRVDFNLKDVARHIKTQVGYKEYRIVSERTVSRYIHLVLEKLGELFDIKYEVTLGRGGGFSMWEDEIVELNEFVPALARKTKKASDRPRIKEWEMRNERIQTAILIDKEKTTKNRSKCFAKGEYLYNGSVPEPMMRLASIIIYQNPVGHTNRLDISQKEMKSIVAEQLTAGAFCLDAVEWLNKAVRITDTMMSDSRIENPVGYVRNTVRTLAKGQHNSTSALKKSKAAKRKYFSDLKADYIKEMQKEKLEPFASVIEKFDRKIAA